MNTKKLNSKDNFLELLSSFIESKKQTKLKEETIYKYNNLLLDFIQYLKNKNVFFLLSINNEVVNNFLIWKLNGSKSLYTKKFIINTVKMFLFFIENKTASTISDIENLRSVKVITQEIFPNFYSQDSLKKILKTLLLRSSGKENKKELFYNVRSSIMVKLLIFSGAKQELRQIRLCAINMSKHEHFIHLTLSRDRRGERIVPISKSTGLLEDLELFKTVSNSDYICSRYSGEIMSRREIEKTVSAIFKNANVPFIGLQGFKHSFAKQLVEDDYSNDRIKELLGYRNIRPVLEYRKIFAKHKD